MKIKLTLLVAITLAALTHAATYSGGDGTPATPYLISSAADLQTLSTTPADWGQSFRLTTNVTVADLSPIGTSATPFSGNFDGNGNVITHNVSAQRDCITGLFGYNSGTITNLTVNGTIAAVEPVPALGSGWVAGIVAINMGTVSDSTYSGTINLDTNTSGDGTYNVYVGGIAAENTGTIIDSSFAGYIGGNVYDVYVAGIAGLNTGTIDGASVGGFATVFVGSNYNFASTTFTVSGAVAGYNGGTILDSDVAAGVFVDNQAWAGLTGGFVGYNEGNITNSSSMANVFFGGTQGVVGGFSGWNYGTISESFAEGDVVVAGSGSIIGGFVGVNKGEDEYGNPTDGTVEKSYFFGDVDFINQGSNVGLFAGTNSSGATIDNSFAIGNMAANPNSVLAGVIGGGFAGVNGAAATITNSYAVDKDAKSQPPYAFDNATFVGGVAGYVESGMLAGNVWNQTTSALATGAGAGSTAGTLGKTTADMKLQATFTAEGWDFATIWGMSDAGSRFEGYPIFTTNPTPAWVDMGTNLYSKMVDAAVFVTLDSVQIATTAGSMVSAWIDGVCVGVNKDAGGNIIAPVMSPIAGKMYIPFQIAGEAGLQVTFKVYDFATKNIYDCQEVFTYNDTVPYGSMPSLNELTVQAATTTWTVTFYPGANGAITAGLASQTVDDGGAAVAPTITPHTGWIFDGWDKDFSNVTSDLTVNAMYTSTAAGWVLYDDFSAATLNDEIWWIDIDGASIVNGVCRLEASNYGNGLEFDQSITTENELTGEPYAWQTFKADVRIDNISLAGGDYSFAGLDIEVQLSNGYQIVVGIVNESGYGYTGEIDIYDELYNWIEVEDFVAEYQQFMTIEVVIEGTIAKVYKNSNLVYSYDLGGEASIEEVEFEAEAGDGEVVASIDNVYYIPTTSETFTVEFDLDGKGTRTGGGELVQTVNEGEAAIAPIITPNAGWVFDGWDVSFDNVTSDLTVTAQYKIRTFTVMFIEGANGTITDNNAVQIVNYGEAAVAPAITANTGWIFIGWDKTFDNITQNTAVYALYESRQWTVIFDAGIGGEITGGEIEQIVDNGDTAIAPTITPNPGWVFTGWDTDLSNITADLTITALYDIQTFSVSFDAGDFGDITSGSSVQIVEYSGSATEPIITADNFMRFVGWNANFDNVTSNLTITAQYAQAGDGTEGNPYLISTIGELEAINLAPYASYKLENNLDLEGLQYQATVIGTFSGNFDGDGFSIDNLLINGVEDSYNGFFGYVLFGAKISNFAINNAQVGLRGDAMGVLAGINYGGIIINCSTSGQIQGQYNHNIGGLIGYDYSGKIIDCSSSVNIIGSYGAGGLVGTAASSESEIIGCYATGNASGTDEFGGLVEENYGTIRNCYATGNFEGFGHNAGGLVRENYGTIDSCFATGHVSTISYDSGGLVGLNMGQISNSYSTGSVTASYEYLLNQAPEGYGGLIGTNYLGKVTNSYSTGIVDGEWFAGGLIGKNQSGQVENCFWNTQTSGRFLSSGGTGETTAQMQTQPTFTDAGWDFVNETENGQMQIWYMLDGGYPKLYWQAEAGDIDYDGYIANSDLEQMAWQWLSQTQEYERLQADINADGVVNFTDFAILSDWWLVSPQD